MHPDCPDYDLCENCETKPIPVHPENHPMLKTKVPLSVDVQSTMDAAGEIAMNSGSRSQNQHRRAHQPRHSGRGDIRCQRGDQERRGPYSRWSQQREHVILAQPFETCAPQIPTPGELMRLKSSVTVEPKVPGGYIVTNNIYDQEGSVSDLAAPIMPDNKAKEEMEPIPDVESTKGEVEEYTVVTVQNIGVTAGDNQESAVKDEGVISKQEPEGITVVCAPPSKDPVTPLDVFSYVRHVTIPPGCQLPSGAEFTKTWAFKHFAAGTEFDVETIRLVHKSEGLLGPACKAVVVFKQSEIEDQKEFDVSIHGLRVPDMPGREIVEFWRFEDDKGVEYGQPLRLR